MSGFLSLIAQGAAIAALGLPWLPATIGGALIIGVTAGWASVLISASFQRVVRGDQMGRVSSLTMLSDYSLMPLAMPLFGWLAATTSVITTSASFGAGMVLMGAWGASRPVIRSLHDRSPGAQTRQ